MNSLTHKKKIAPSNYKKELEKKLAKGIQQLNNGKGSDFGLLINRLKKKHSKN